MKTDAKRETVINAINEINARFNYKIELNRDDQQGKWFHFTIKSEKSGIPGSRYSWSGRKLVSASWHAHGHLFDEIFKEDPNAIIWSAGNKITIESGNWQDKNIGSYFCPVYFSETSIL